jgi:hemin uptake protein HemP
MQVEEKQTAAQLQSSAAPAPRRVNASVLFGSAREVVIAHNGREYRLRITAQKKLILTA